MNATDNEITTIEHLDFDPDTPCCGKQNTCENEVQWSGALSCCGYRDLFCDECKGIINGIIELFGIRHAGTPDSCGHKVDRVIWEHL